MKSLIKPLFKPQRLAANDIATVAAAGVERALQARADCLRELSAQEITDVSGGATFSSLASLAIIAGGRPVDLYSTKLSPQLDPQAGALSNSLTLMG